MRTTHQRIDFRRITPLLFLFMCVCRITSNREISPVVSSDKDDALLKREGLEHTTDDSAMPFREHALAILGSLQGQYHTPKTCQKEFLTVCDCTN